MDDKIFADLTNDVDRALADLTNQLPNAITQEKFQRAVKEQVTPHLDGLRGEIDKLRREKAALKVELKNKEALNGHLRNGLSKEFDEIKKHQDEVQAKLDGCNGEIAQAHKTNENLSLRVAELIRERDSLVDEKIQTICRNRMEEPLTPAVHEMPENGYCLGGAVGVSIQRGHVNVRAGLNVVQSTNPSVGFPISDDLRGKGLVEIQYGAPESPHAGPFVRANIASKHGKISYEAAYTGKPVGELSVSTTDYFASVKTNADEAGLVQPIFQNIRNQNVLFGKNDTTAFEHFDTVMRTPIATLRDATELLLAAPVRNTDSSMQHASFQPSVAPVVPQPGLQPVVSNGTSAVRMDIDLILVSSTVGLLLKAFLKRLRSTR